MLLGLPVLLAAVAAGLAAGDDPLPPPPVPAGNPVTEAKRVLGKILFWDEQLSSDGTMACGTCHFPELSGTDVRVAPAPGFDGVPQTADDVLASPGMLRATASGDYRGSPGGLRPQVTPRSANPVLMAAYAPELFWDGRASGTFRDPVSGAVVLATGAALESQAVVPITSPVEMAHEDRDWTAVTARLTGARPLALADDLPDDLAQALAAGEGYPDLFAAAFGDPAVTPERVARALATYQRTLVPDATPWDRWIAGDADALTPAQRNGASAFAAIGCADCHPPPHFTDFSFRNIGLRPSFEDRGRASVTGSPDDEGAFKVPSLRNVTLKETYMHDGRFDTIEQVLDHYGRRPGSTQFTADIDPLVPAINITEPQRLNLIDFLRFGLTDPRVEAGTFPFDRPTLYGERSETAVVPLGGAVPGSGGRPPRLVATAPPLVDGDLFKVGIDAARPGANALLAVGSTDPGTGPLVPDRTVGPIVLDGSGVGTAPVALAGPGDRAGDVRYLQWAVDDPAAPGGTARSAVVRVVLVGTAVETVVDGDPLLCASRARLTVDWRGHDRGRARDAARLDGVLNLRGAGRLDGARLTVAVEGTTLLDGVTLDARGRGRSERGAEPRWSVSLDPRTGRFRVRLARADLRDLLTGVDGPGADLGVTVGVAGANLAVPEAAATLPFAVAARPGVRTRASFGGGGAAAREGAFRVERARARTAADGSTTFAIRGHLAAPASGAPDPTGDLVLRVADSGALRLPLTAARGAVPRLQWRREGSVGRFDLATDRAAFSLRVTLPSGAVPDGDLDLEIEVPTASGVLRFRTVVAAAAVR